MQVIFSAALNFYYKTLKIRTTIGYSYKLGLVKTVVNESKYQNLAISSFKDVQNNLQEIAGFNKVGINAS